MLHSQGLANFPNAKLMRMRVITTIRITVQYAALLAATAHMSTASSQNMDSLNLATQDLNEGKALPGLPDLTKPVYLSSGSTVCNTIASLANPNKDILVQIGECTISRNKIRVNINVPATPESYLNAHMQRAVEIVWRPEAQSNANRFSAWTAIRNLEN